MRAFALAALSLIALTLTAPGGRAAGGELRLELVGVVSNTPPGATPATSTQYGYLSYVLGLQAFKGEPENEATALFTFYAQATTVRVVADGPLRVITRVGTFTIYRDPAANARFDDPNTFREGTRVLVANFRQEVVLDTVSETFTTVNRNTIAATTPFAVGARTIRLGPVRGRFNTVLSGHLNMPGPPSGYFAGYTIGVSG